MSLAAEMRAGKAALAFVLLRPASSLCFLLFASLLKLLVFSLALLLACRLPLCFAFS